MQNVNSRCQCLVERTPSGILHAVTKCEQHVRELLREMRSEEQHYHDLGALSNPGVYINEFEECFGKIERGDGTALEIGAGTSPYINMIQQAGYAYMAIETSPFACKWLRKSELLRASGMTNCVTEGSWEDLPPLNRYKLILAAHVLEHMHDATKSLYRMYEDMLPGGFLYIIVPNDDDLCNPDHWWFFTPASLTNAVTEAGFQVLSVDLKQRIERERFIYLKAVKK